VHQDKGKEADAAREKLCQYEALLANEVSSYQLKLIQQLSISSTARPLSTIEERQKKKLQDLRARVECPETNQEDHVYNLSDRTLNNEEKEALGYGMKMCWPQNACEVEIKTEAEALYRKIRRSEPGDLLEVKTKLLSLVNAITKTKTKVPRKIRKMMDTLKSLSKEEDLYISRLDKGNGVVLLNKSDYITKMEKILDDQTKFKEAKNTSDTLYINKEKQVNQSLLQLRKQGEISDKLYRQLRSTGCQPSRLYGLPKKYTRTRTTLHCGPSYP